MKGFQQLSIHRDLTCEICYVNVFEKNVPPTFHIHKTFHQDHLITCLELERCINIIVIITKDKQLGYDRNRRNIRPELEPDLELRFRMAGILVPVPAGDGPILVIAKTISKRIHQ